MTNYGFENMVALAQKRRLKIPEGPGTIIITDIGVNEESCLPVFKALQDAKEMGWQNIWLDHHVWPERPRQEIEQICELILSSSEEVRKCASELR